MIQTIVSEHNGMSPMLFAGVKLMARIYDSQRFYSDIGEIKRLAYEKVKEIQSLNKIGNTENVDFSKIKIKATLSFKYINPLISSSFLDEYVFDILGYAENEFCDRAQTKFTHITIGIKIRDMKPDIEYEASIAEYSPWELIR